MKASARVLFECINIKTDVKSLNVLQKKTIISSVIIIYQRVSHSFFPSFNPLFIFTLHRTHLSETRRNVNGIF